jgi:hypothetical protein
MTDDFEHGLIKARDYWQKRADIAQHELDALPNMRKQARKELTRFRDKCIRAADRAEELILSKYPIIHRTKER